MNEVTHFLFIDHRFSTLAVIAVVILLSFLSKKLRDNLKWVAIALLTVIVFSFAYSHLMGESVTQLPQRINQWFSSEQASPPEPSHHYYPTQKELDKRLPPR